VHLHHHQPAPASDFIDTQANVGSKSEEDKKIKEKIIIRILSRIASGEEMKRGCTSLAGTAGARWGAARKCQAHMLMSSNEFRSFLLPRTTRVIGGAAMRRNYAERVKVDYHYGHEKFKKEDEPSFQEAEASDDKPRVKGAKLSGVQGGAKTRRWYKQVSVGKPLHSTPPLHHTTSCSRLALDLTGLISCGLCV
jgi:hypothetical protein